MNYAALIGLGLQLLQTIIGSFTKSQVPAEVVAALQSAATAVEAHYNDAVTKAELEAQRG